MTKLSKPRVLVVGAGIIGICTAVQLQRRGCVVSIIDSHAPASMTSFGNAGGIAVTEVTPLNTPGMLWRLPKWLFDPMGPLTLRWRELPALAPWLWRFYQACEISRVRKSAAALADLMRTGYPDYLPLWKDAGVMHMVGSTGALAVYRSEAARARDHLDWEIKHSHGVHCDFVGSEVLRQLEPALDLQFQCGVLLADWRHVRDPHRIATAIAKRFLQDGGELLNGRIVDFDGLSDARVDQALTEDGRALGFDHYVIAAGVWSKFLCAKLGDPVPLISERGYNTTLPNPKLVVRRQLVFAEDKFVITPMEMGLRIGGAVELASPTATPNYARAKALLRLGKRYLPGLNDQDGSEWMGNRPSLPDSLPVIGRTSSFSNVYYAFGHGHLGLTQAATTGRLIAMLVAGEHPDIDLSPFRIDRF